MLADEKNKNDQLNKIFDVIGTPSESEDLSFLKQENAIKYIKSFKPREKTDLLDKYPGTHEDGISILSRMLEFNPSKRISAEEALKCKYFDEVRIRD